MKFQIGDCRVISGKVSPKLCLPIAAGGCRWGGKNLDWRSQLTLQQVLSLIGEINQRLFVDSASGNNTGLSIVRKFTEYDRRYECPRVFSWKIQSEPIFQRALKWKMHVLVLLFVLYGERSIIYSLFVKIVLYLNTY